MQVPAQVAEFSDGERGPHGELSPGVVGRGQMMDEEATTPPEVDPGEHADDDSEMLEGGTACDVSDVCVAATSDQGSRGILSRGHSALASSIGSPVEQLDGEEHPEMEPHAVAGGSNERTGPVRDDSFQSKRNPKVQVPKINVNPEHLREREESLHRESSRPIVSFSARLPDEFEVRRDMVRDHPPGALGKLLEVNRSRGHTTERASYRTFEKRATAAFQDPNIRIQTFFDQSIMPRHAKGITPRAELPIHGTSPLELIFDFYAGRQQPGTGGMSSDTRFDKISGANVSMSFPELLRFVQVMLSMNSYTLQEVQWVLRKAKSSPYGKEEGNWHGDVSTEINDLNFVEWLSCVVRLSLISHGSRGKNPEQCIDEVAREMQLHNQRECKARIARIARTQAGFGAWTDDATPRESLTPLAINLRRGKALDDFMLDKHGMLKLQHRLLSRSRTPQNSQWSSFDGPYISMVVPTTAKGQSHKFQVIVQNTAHSVFNVSFRLDGLPFMSAFHTPAKSFCASGLDCVCELKAVVPHIGEYQGDLEVTDLKGLVVHARVPVYLRVISGGDTSYLVENVKPGAPGNPFHKTLSKGSLSHRIYSKGGGESDGLLKRGMTSPSGRDMFKTVEKRMSKSAAALVRPLSVRDAQHHSGAMPLHPTMRKGAKQASRQKMRIMTPKSRDPMEVSYTPGSAARSINSPTNFTRTHSGALTGPHSWLSGIAYKSSVPQRLAV